MIVVKMAEGETEREYDTRKAIEELRERFQALTAALKESSQSALEASLHFCQEFCQVSPGSAAAHPRAAAAAACSRSGFWPRMRVYVRYNNVAAELAAELS